MFPPERWKSDPQEGKYIVNQFLSSRVKTGSQVCLTPRCLYICNYWSQRKFKLTDFSQQKLYSWTVRPNFFFFKSSSWVRKNKHKFTQKKNSAVMQRKTVQANNWWIRESVNHTGNGFSYGVVYTPLKGMPVPLHVKWCLTHRINVAYLYRLSILLKYIWGTIL